MYRIQKWNDRLIGFAFWSINIGLMLMLMLSLLPMGILQAIASVNEGMWYARSAEFLKGPGMDNIKWLRVIGDTIFAMGLFAFVWFVFSLDSKRRHPEDKKPAEDAKSV
jgi:nitric oxide reductase subunit B